MQIYNKQLSFFAKSLKQAAVDFGHECGYAFSTPVKRRVKGKVVKEDKLLMEVVIYEGKSLGFYERQFGKPVIGINKRLVNEDFKIARDILKHELAHYICDKRFEDGCQSHGPRFRRVCKEIGANALAKESLDSMDKRLKATDIDKILDKVKKLMSLGTSSNVHEAERAMLKANELLMKHNLTHLNDEGKDLYFQRLFEIKQINGKSRCMVNILRSFGVFPVFNAWTKRGYVIEVSGSKTNVQIADYVAQFLDRELEKLYKKARKEDGFGGLRAKNAFFAGLSRGYLSKFEKQKEEIEKSDTSNQLQAYRKEIADMAEELIYEKLTGTRSSEAGHMDARDSGYETGKKLSISQGVQSGKKTLQIGHD